MMNEAELQRLKKFELNMLQSFVDVCNTLGLTYYLIGGTLIGAIRHKGFIPWDDDIDVIMPRKDYDVFLEKAQTLLPNDLFLQTYVTDPEYPFCFAKIRDTNTTFIEHTLSNRKINHGIYIDIFPLDYCPTNKIKRKIMLIKDYLMSVSISRVFNVEVSKKMKLVRFFASICYPSINKTIKKREQMFKSVDNSNIVKNYCSAWSPEKEEWCNIWFQEGVQVEFEGVYYNAPKDYDSVLRHVYGDYMILPPKEEQIAHHFVDTIDFDKSYIYYC